MNNLCAGVLANCLAPVFTPEDPLNSRIYGRSPYSTILDSLCSIPGYPFVNIVSTPIQADQHIEYSNNTWVNLTKRGAQMQLSNTQEPNIN